MSYPFDPDWCMAPSAVLEEVLEDYGMSVATLAKHCASGYLTDGMAALLLQEVLDRKPLTELHAETIARGTGTAVSLWLGLERNYRVGLAAGKIDATDLRGAGMTDADFTLENPSGRPEADRFRIGGLMRCCTETIGDLYPPGITRAGYEGMTLLCKYREPGRPGHGHMIFRAGAWEWDSGADDAESAQARLADMKTHAASTAPRAGRERDGDRAE